MVDFPNVENILRDESSKITYRVMAYRKLTREEVLTAIAYNVARLKKKDRPKPNSTVTIISVIH